EEHFLDCPECIHSLEVTEGFRTGLRIVAAERSAAFAVIGLLGALARISKARQMAFITMALLVLVLPTALLVSQLKRTRGELRQARSVSAEQQRQDAEKRQSIQNLETKLKATQQTLGEQRKQLAAKSRVNMKVSNTYARLSQKLAMEKSLVS